MYLVFFLFFLFFSRKFLNYQEIEKLWYILIFFININAKFKKGQKIGSYEEPWHIKYENMKMNRVRKTKFLLT